MVLRKQFSSQRDDFSKTIFTLLIPLPLPLSTTLHDAGREKKTQKQKINKGICIFYDVCFHFQSLIFLSSKLRQMNLVNVYFFACLWKTKSLPLGENLEGSTWDLEEKRREKLRDFFLRYPVSGKWWWEMGILFFSVFSGREILFQTHWALKRKRKWTTSTPFLNHFQD